MCQPLQIFSSHEPEAHAYSLGSRAYSIDRHPSSYFINFKQLLPEATGETEVNLHIEPS